jgi:hypothetical protein
MPFHFFPEISDRVVNYEDQYIVKYKNQYRYISSNAEIVGDPIESSESLLDLGTRYFNLSK